MIKLPVQLLIFLILISSLSSIAYPLVGPIEKNDSLVAVVGEDLEKFGVNKLIPDEIRDVTLMALSHYPDLMEVKIDFQFQKNINGSVMQAQPKIGSLILDNKKNRSYRIKISRHLQLLDEMLPIEELPTDVLLGWLGHELGHVMDYIDRSALNLMGFGVKYFVSDKFVSLAEAAADGYSVSNGLAKAIIASKDFVLNNEGLSEDYKNKIRTLYLSPGEVLSLVDVEEGQN